MHELAHSHKAILHHMVPMSYAAKEPIWCSFRLQMGWVSVSATYQNQILANLKPNLISRIAILLAWYRPVQTGSE